ncbi:MAG: hypothetical protein AAF909_13320, partial [Pseudomonadota bacterium]
MAVRLIYGAAKVALLLAGWWIWVLLMVPVAHHTLMPERDPWFTVGISFLALLLLLLFSILYVLHRRYILERSWRQMWRGYFRYIAIGLTSALVVALPLSHFGSRICYWPPSFMTDEKAAALIFDREVNTVQGSFKFGVVKKKTSASGPAQNKRF